MADGRRTFEPGIVVRDIQSKSIISKSKLADYSVNPYVGCAHACRYCYAMYMTVYSGHEEPWGSFVDVKHWPAVRDPSKYAGKTIFVGSVTDPYQPAEKEARRTRAFLEQMQGSGASVAITTKSDLVLRDLDLIKNLPGSSITWSVNTLDEAFRRDMDAAVPISSRLAAMKEAFDAGISTTCFAAPVFPGITGVPSIILAVRDRCSTVLVDRLNLRGTNKSEVFAYIREKRPDLLPMYISIYENGDERYWDALHRQLTKFAAAEGLPYRAGSSSRWEESAAAGGSPEIVAVMRRDRRKNGRGGGT